MAKPTRHAAAGPSQRQLRVSELIRHALAEMIQRGDIHDEVLASHIVTIPEVRLSPDLKLATVYIMPLGGKDEKPVIAALEKHKGYLRGQIAHKVNMKYAPDLRFRRDETFDEAERITKLLRTDEVKRDLGRKDSTEDEA
ncbi:MAG: 30S ribosome-binding factor RbfA [Bosea sp. (in: a-proteobacteria)]